MANSGGSSNDRVAKAITKKGAALLFLFWLVRWAIAATSDNIDVVLLLGLGGGPYDRGPIDAGDSALRSEQIKTLAEGFCPFPRISSRFATPF